MNEMSLQDIADMLNSFEWWTLIVGNDAREFQQNILTILAPLPRDGDTWKWLEFPGAGYVLFVRKSQLSERRLRTALDQPLRQNSQAVSDVVVTPTPKTMRITEFLHERLPTIDAGYGRNERN